MTQATVTALVERLYGALLDEGDWPGLLRDVVDAFDGTQGALVSQDDCSGIAEVQAHTVGISDQVLHDYETYYGPRSPLFHFLKTMPLGTPYTDGDFPDQTVYQGSEIYNDLYRPLNAEHLLGVDLERNSGVSTYLMVRRGTDAGHFTAPEVRRLAGLVNHFTRALRLGRLMEGAERTAGALEGVLNCLPAPVILTDGDGHVAYLNAAAERMLVENGGLRLNRGRLRCERPVDGLALDRLIEEAGRADPSGGGVVAVWCRSSTQPLMVEVLPLPSSLGAAPRRRMVMLRVAARRTRRPEPNSIVRLLGLTPAEADVAAALCRGDSITEHATRAGISPHTARTLLRNAMAKTDTHRQAELVAVVLSTVWSSSNGELASAQQSKTGV